MIVLPTDANRNLGIFLIFVGLTGSGPLWYLWCVWFGHMPRSIHGWYPAFLMAGVLVLLGYLLAAHSHKTIAVAADCVRVWDGLFRKPLRFTWDGTPAIRLQQLENELSARPRVQWITRLVSGRYEFTLDERRAQQLQSRALAEALARALSCPLLEKAPDGTPMTIQAQDLDLPFHERARRYPNLLGPAVEPPAPLPVRIVRSSDVVRYRWSVATTGLVRDVAILAALILVVTAIPPSATQPSLLETSRASGDFRIYVWLGAVLSTFLLIVAGFRVSLTLAPDRVGTRESLWGIPVGARSIPIGVVEEVQLYRSVRGSTVQVISDAQMFQFRVSDPETAAWLTYEIRRHLMQVEPVSAATSLSSEAAPAAGRP